MDLRKEQAILVLGGFTAGLCVLALYERFCVGKQRTLTQWQVVVRDDKKVECSSQDTTLTSRFPLTFLGDIPVPAPLMKNPARYPWLRRNIKLRPGDVYVATFPKCGTTWCENIVVLLLHGLDAPLDPLSKNTYNRSTGVGKIWPTVNVWADPKKNTLPFHKGEMALTMDLQEFDQVKGRRLLKSHMPRDMLLGADPDTDALPDHAKIVVVTRSPMDACVSAFHHFGDGWPFDAFVGRWLMGTCGWGTWFEHTKGWVEAAREEPEKILLLRYEDMKADPVGSVSRIAKHIGIEADQEFCKGVAARSSFKAMKAKAVETEKTVKNSSSHLRGGRVGDSAKYFTEQTAREFEAVCRFRTLERVSMYDV